MPRTYNQEEKQIRNTISGYLTALNIPHTVTDAAIVKIGDQVRMSSVDPSWPDLTGALPARVSPLLAGRMLAVEVKTKTGRLNPGRFVKRGFHRVWIRSQKEVLEDLRKAGAVAIVARSIEDVRDGLRIAEECVRQAIDFVHGLPELK